MSLETIIQVVQDIQSNRKNLLDSFRKLYQMWITSGLDQNDLYRTIQYVESSLDHIPDQSNRHLFADEAIIKYDFESKEFFKFHQKDIEKFCDDFSQYIEKNRKEKRLKRNKISEGDSQNLQASRILSSAMASL